VKHWGETVGSMIPWSLGHDGVLSSGIIPFLKKPTFCRLVNYPWNYPLVGGDWNHWNHWNLFYDYPMIIVHHIGKFMIPTDELSSSYFSEG